MQDYVFLASIPFYRNHTLFQPVAFDQLFWILGFYYIIRYLNTAEHRYLIFTDIIFGLGLLTKYTIIVWAFGIFMGMLFYERGRVFRNKWWYLSGVIALHIVFPNVIWQFNNSWSFIRHLRELKDNHLSERSIYEFGLRQLEHLFTIIISLLGASLV